MWKLRKTKNNGLNQELTYASHHHLIPLYAMSGTLVVAVLVLASFVIVLWQDDQKQALVPAIDTSISAVENLYLSSAVSGGEKKQYIYPANVRFTLTSPYNTLRYNYDPGVAGTSTSATISLTTSATLQTLETPLRQDPLHSTAYLQNFQQCSKLYAIRFQPGVTPFGGFTPLKDVKLKDGRTAYIHKNTSCVPQSTQAMDNLDDVEAAVMSIESY